MKTSAELQDYFNEQDKKSTNQQFVDNESDNFLPSNPDFRALETIKNVINLMNLLEIKEMYMHIPQISTQIKII